MPCKYLPLIGTIAMPSRKHNIEALGVSSENSLSLPNNFSTWEVKLLVACVVFSDIIETFRTSILQRDVDNLGYP